MPQDAESQRRIKILMEQYGMSYQNAYELVAAGSGSSDQGAAVEGYTDEAAGGPAPEDTPRAPTPLPEGHDPLATPKTLEPEAVGEVDLTKPTGELSPKESVLWKEGRKVVPERQTGDRGLVDNILGSHKPRPVDPRIMTEPEMEKARRDNEREAAIREGTFVAPGGLMEGGYVKKIQGRQQVEEKDRLIAQFLNDNDMYDEDGNVDEEKLAHPDLYPVRAWLETKRVLSGQGGTEGPRGESHTDWEGNNTRRDRLVKISHFNTSGQVVPHPTREGEFILAGKDGSQIQDMSGPWGEDNRLGKAERIERNVDRMITQPGRYAGAIKGATDRRRRIEGQREIGRGNRHGGIAMIMNLPMDHPAVLDKVKGAEHTAALGYRSKFRNIRTGPSPSAGSWASYFAPQPTGAGKGGSSSAARARPGDWHNTADAINARDAAKTAGLHLNDAEEKSRSGTPDEQDRALNAIPGLSKRHKQAQSDLRNAELKYNRGGAPGRGATAGQPAMTRDLRGVDMRGHFDKEFLPVSANPWQMLKGVSHTRRLQDDWDEWLATQGQDGADAVDENTLERVNTEVAKGEERTAPKKIEGQGGVHGPPRHGFPTVGGDSEMTGTSLYGPGEPSDLATAIATRRASEGSGIPEDAPQPVPPRPLSEGPQYTPKGSGDIDPRDFDSTSIKPYQPTIGEGGEIVTEPIGKYTQYKDDMDFDNIHGPKLWAIRRSLEGKFGAGTEDSWWQGVKYLFGGAEPETPASQWYNTFMERARDAVYPGHDQLEEGGLNELDNKILRWGMRHIGIDSGNPEASVMFSAQNPARTRGRDPAIKGPAEEGFLKKYDEYYSHPQSTLKAPYDMAADFGDTVRRYSPEWLKSAQDWVADW